MRRVKFYTFLYNPCVTSSFSADTADMVPSPRLPCIPCGLAGVEIGPTLVLSSTSQVEALVQGNANYYGERADFVEALAWDLDRGEWSEWRYGGPIYPILSAWLCMRTRGIGSGLMMS